MARTYSLISLSFLILLSGCGHKPALRVDEAILKLSPVDSNPSALYFTVHGGPKDVSLLRVDTPSALRTEMHESMMDHGSGAMAMQPMDKVLIPAKGKVEFKQGGKHVMVWGVNYRARRLGTIATEYVFSDGSRIAVDAVVQEMDGSIPDEMKALK